MTIDGIVARGSLPASEEAAIKCARASLGIMSTIRDKALALGQRQAGKVLRPAPTCIDLREVLSNVEAMTGAARKPAPSVCVPHMSLASEDTCAAYASRRVDWQGQGHLCRLRHRGGRARDGPHRRWVGGDDLGQLPEQCPQVYERGGRLRERVHQGRAGWQSALRRFRHGP
eukprot:7375872-Prymnesium_polylepis.1